LKFEKHSVSFAGLSSKFEKLMEWDDFKHFLAVARLGSLSEAARELKTSPATVGRRVAALEERLSTRLFDRKQTGYALTEGGEAIRSKAEDIEEAILSVEREAFGRDRKSACGDG
jgi:DNA-binding transcriptional LysR family regulator